MKRKTALLSVVASLAFVTVALSQSTCDVVFNDCMINCRGGGAGIGPPVPGCYSNCQQAYHNCEAGGVCSPFCPG